MREQESVKALALFWGYVGMDGRWYPNDALKMTADEQAESNRKNGLLCEHYFVPHSCPRCNK